MHKWYQYCDDAGVNSTANLTEVTNHAQCAMVVLGHNLTADTGELHVYTAVHYILYFSLL